MSFRDAEAFKSDPHDDEVVLDAEGRAYPSHYAPGSHWAVDRSWEILDFFPPDFCTRAQRFILAGMIAGALMRAKSGGP